jgi:hypothetical protein
MIVTGSHAQLLACRRAIRPIFKTVRKRTWLLAEDDLLFPQQILEG